MMAELIDARQITPHNLDLYRLQGFSGCRDQLLRLHEWIFTHHAVPAIAISGEQGNGKSTIATAAAWSNIHHFVDGVVWVSAAGGNPFRLYDIVRTMDTVLGTQLTRVSEERWGISILEKLYRRKVLLVVDKLAGASEREIDTLVDIIGHLHDSGGNSRIILIDRNFSPAIAGLVRRQHLHMDGIPVKDIAQFVDVRAPGDIARQIEPHLADLYVLTQGRPLLLRLVLGLLLDYSWADLSNLFAGLKRRDGILPIQDVVAFAIENFASARPQVGPLISRLVRAAGGASLTALEELFWHDLGGDDELQTVLNGMTDRALLEKDDFAGRVVMHPLIRRYLEQHVEILGEDWDRTHARYYLNFAKRYQSLPQERWPEVDVEWGNIYQAADWCAARTQRLWERDPLDVLADGPAEWTALAIPAAAQEAKSDLRLVRGYALALAYYAFWRHPLGTLRWLSSGALASAALSDLSDYAWLQANIGRQLFFANRVTEAIQWFERARDIFDRHDLLDELAYVFTDLGTSYRILNRPRVALRYFQGALDVVSQISDLVALTTAHLNLGSAYYSLESYDDALAEHHKALRIALRRRDEHSIASAYNNIGLTLEGMQRLAEARSAYESALELFKRVVDVTGISTCYNNLGSASYAQEDYAHALEWYRLDLELSRSRGQWTDMAATLHNLGHVALEQSDLSQALTYFEESRDLYADFDLEEYVQEEIEMIDYVREQLDQRT